MKKNSKGEDVFWLQSKLKELGYYSGHIGGVYLDGTVKAVKAFQKDHGLEDTGLADAATRQAIDGAWETATGKSAAPVLNAEERASAAEAQAIEE